MEIRPITNHFWIDHFCFILGAGASVTSGIPSGRTLAWQWLEEMHRREDTTRGRLEDWATAENLGEEAFEDFDLDRYAEWYPQLFERYFRGNFDFANAYLQDMMKKATPSFGYSILAWILARTRHSVIITTNFDNLVGDSLFLYAHTSPLVIGHESLARFVRTEPGRPLVCKIHRDLLLDPMNDVDSVSYLRTEWAEALHKLLKRFTPIVIGYGGNDGSLMNFLQHMPSLGADGMFWAYRSQDTPPDRIQRLIRKHQGWAVPIYGFDELMAQFAEIFAVGNLYDELKRSAEETCKKYKTAGRELIYRFVDELAEQTTGTERERLYRAAIYHADQSDLKEEWAYWEIHARAAITPDAKEKAYKDGLTKLPDSAHLLGNYAFFLDTLGTKPDEAEAVYKRAIEASPRDADYLGNYALFLEKVRNKPDEAEVSYKRAIEANQEHANNLGNYAVFLKNVRNKPDEAEIFYKRAIEANPKHANNLGNYALFLKNVRNKPDEAETFYKRAIETSPRHANILNNYAYFLADIRNQSDEAETFYKRAIEAAPENATFLGNYANFLKNVRNKSAEAEAFFKRALEADPEHANNLIDYAKLLGESPGQIQRALEMAKEAFRISPSNDRARKLVQTLETPNMSRAKNGSKTRNGKRPKKTRKKPAGTAG
ncbi:MAG TPA: tetratricopeptide repeat protein [Chthoniobacterales bacterium]|nr:tetratricopeptide repeat protein [Chthoniobacterales bacterium]